MRLLRKPFQGSVKRAFEEQCQILGRQFSLGAVIAGEPSADGLSLQYGQGQNRRQGYNHWNCFVAVV